MRKYFLNEQALAQKGEFVLKISNKTDSAEVLSYFLRDHRGRRDLAETLNVLNPNNQSGFIGQIDQIRSLLESAKFDEAKEVLGKTKPGNVHDELELELEHSRWLYFCGKFNESQRGFDYLINHPQTLSTTRMTALQMLGLCYYQALDIPRAISFLEKSVRIWEFYPYAHSGAVAMAYLIKIHSDQNNRLKAKDLLGLYAKSLEQIENNDTWLSIYLVFLRAQFHFYKNQNFEIARVFFYEALTIANWSGDWQIQKKCESDLQDFPTLQERESDCCVTGKNWYYLRNSMILLQNHPRKVLKFNTSPILNSIILNLSQGPLSEGALFEKVWGMNYTKNRHSGHVRSTISSLRKKMPVGCLIYKNQKYYLY